MSELVAKNSSAIEVDDELTTLIDWTNIEELSGFTVIVENAGGGSANDITDAQIDTSDDGGETSQLDEHDGVPAVPIADGNSKKGIFTETSKFVRVRAVCAEGEDTTANAWLMADSSVGRICTLADIKDRMGLTNTDHDSTINRLILGVEQMFDNETRRKLLQNTLDETEYYTGQGPHLQLRRYPVISITSIVVSYDYTFNETALTENTDYRLINNGKKGVIYRVYSDWSSLEDSIQIAYRGGYCPAGQTPGTGEIVMPADLREAAIEQVCFLFQRRNDLGLAGVSFEGGSMSKFSSIKLLPLVEDVLKKHRRPQL